jgi:hypothetical protein
MKQRFQNVVVGDIVRLRLLTYSSNNLANVSSIEQLDIYYLDPNNCSSDNPTGKTLVATISGSDAVNEDIGKYYYDLVTSHPTYLIGKYLDVWTVVLEEGTDSVTFEQEFSIYPQLWYTSPIPIIHDFDFKFTPHRMRQGSVKPLIITIIPKVPTATELQRYYANIAIYADLSISIAKKCNPCASDLDLIVEDELIEDREKCQAFYQLDTTEMECGLYDIWMKLTFGSNTYISDKEQLMIY